MATTASGVTIPGSSPTTTAATPIQDHWNNLGLSLNGRVVVPVASVTARAALVSALAAEGYTPSTSKPIFVFRADATPGFQTEVTTDGSTFTRIGGAAPIVYTDAGLATTGTADAFTTALRTVTNPFGPGVPFRCKATYYLGYIAGTTSARAWVDVNSVGVYWATITQYSSAAPSITVDMPTGGSVNFRGAIRTKGGALSTVVDEGCHYMLTEVTPL